MTLFSMGNFGNDFGLLNCLLYRFLTHTRFCSKSRASTVAWKYCIPNRPSQSSTNGLSSGKTEISVFRTVMLPTLSSEITPRLQGSRPMYGYKWRSLIRFLFVPDSMNTSSAGLILRSLFSLSARQTAISLPHSPHISLQYLGTLTKLHNSSPTN